MSHVINIEVVLRAQERAIDGYLMQDGSGDLRMLVGTLQHHVNKEPNQEILSDDPGIRMMAHQISALVGIGKHYSNEDFLKDYLHCEEVNRKLRGRS